MMRRIVYIISGVACVCAVAWLVSQPNWEPAVAVLTAFSTLLGFIAVNGRSGQVDPGYEEKWVDFQYPNDSGLQERLTIAGYRVAWCLDTKLSRKIDLEGWEIVTEIDEMGIPTRFRLKGKPANQTLIKKRVNGPSA